MTAVDTGVKIKVAKEQICLGEFSNEWYRNRVQGLINDNQPVCIVVCVDIDDVRVNLRTLNCSVGGGGRQPRTKEEQVLRMWEQFGFLDPEFDPWKLPEFLAKLSDFL